MLIFFCLQPCCPFYVHLVIFKVIPHYFHNRQRPTNDNYILSDRPIRGNPDKYLKYWGGVFCLIKEADKRVGTVRQTWIRMSWNELDVLHAPPWTYLICLRWGRWGVQAGGTSSEWLRYSSSSHLGYNPRPIPSQGYPLNSLLQAQQCTVKCMHWMVHNFFHFPHNLISPLLSEVLQVSL